MSCTEKILVPLYIRKWSTRSEILLFIHIRIHERNVQKWVELRVRIVAHAQYCVYKLKMAFGLRLRVFLLVGLLTPLSLDAIKGVDVSGLLDNYDFKDFMEDGFDGFVIFQGYQSDGNVNPHAVNSSSGAYEAGFSNFDMYMCPCPKCNKTAEQQVQEMGKL